MALSGCASHIADSVPAMVGGLPEKVPARSETPPEFPAVHDRPAPRAEGLAPEEPAKKKVAEPAAKKKKSEPTATGSVPTAGAAPKP
jgi:hypothetical protein